MKSLLRVVHNLLIVCFFFTAAISAHADHTLPVTGQFVTKIIKSSSGKLTIEVRYTVTDTIFVNSTPNSQNSATNQRVVLLPDGAPDWKQRQYLPGETFTVVYKFAFDNSDLPLTPFEVETSLPYNIVRIAKAPNKQTEEVETLYCKSFAMVYFRGDKTVEIANPFDFNRLDRVWFTSSSKLTFKAVDPSLIPQSDLYPLDTVREEWENDYQLHFVEGLPYMVATKAVHPDTIAKYNNDDLPYGVVADSTFEDGDAREISNGRTAGLSRGFRGVIRGRLVTTYVNDLNRIVQMPLAGIFMKLLEKDFIYSEEFASAHTDADGNFTLTYARGQSFAEGADLELLIKIKTENETFNIKVKALEMVGSTYSVTHWVGHSIGRDVNMDLGEIALENPSFRPVHWAFRCWTHAVSQGVPMFPKLTILINRRGSKFIPTVPGVTPVEFRPTIQLTETATRIENTMYHEFGHFLMWQAQGRNYILVPGLGPDHFWDQENTTRLAWSEGWADAHEFILDGVLRDDDQEYGQDDTHGRAPVMEERVIDWERNINNGLQSEYFIACAIYDLWDGADKGLPTVFPGSTTLHGFNDFITYTGTSPWVAPEDISYSFRDIIQPLMSHGGLTGKIGNIWEYYKYFLDEVVGTSCAERERVSRVFNENHVVFDLRAFQAARGYGSMSSDDLGVNVSRRITGILPLNKIYHYDDVYLLSNFRDTGVTSNTIDFRFFPSSNMTISDFDISGSVNLSGTVLTSTNVNLNTSASPSGQANQKNGTLILCARTGMIMTSGILTLGGPDNFKAALEIGDQSVVIIERAGSLVINNGSTIIVRSGGSLILSAGATLTALGNGNIIVEAGGFICIDPGALVNLQDVESRILLRAGARTGINPAIGFTGTCANPCSIVYSGLGAIVNESMIALVVNGPSRVTTQSEHKFAVASTPGVTYTWTVSGDASIISGQNTSEVTVVAGTSEFIINVTAVNASACQLQSGMLTVQIEESVNALHFDGDNDLITLRDRADLNFGQGDFTFEVKFQTGFINTSFVPQILLSNRSFVDGGVADGFILGLLSTGEAFIQLAGAPNHFVSRDVMDGACHHLAVSRSNNTHKLFVDGELMLTTTSSRNISSERSIVIGRDIPVGTSFNGEIGEVRIWNSALTDLVITNNIGTDYIGNEPNLVGLWNMNTKEAGVITDVVSGIASELGDLNIGDNREPEWTLNTTCGFSMFRAPDHSASNSSRLKEFITGAKPGQDSIKNELTALKSFPNPASEETTLYLKSEKDEDLSLEIVDSFGNLVHSSTGHRTNEAIKILTPWKPGIYIVRARYGGRIHENKIVKL